jgi:hypothetical protein
VQPAGGAQPTVYYSYHIGMCQRAAELGHSLLFPAICRYCGEQIYLFATPEGGFAIFDDVGGDWPKHECWGVDQSTTRYTDIRPTYSPSVDT